MHTDQAISNIRCQVEDTEFKIQGWALPTFPPGRKTLFISFPSSCLGTPLLAKLLLAFKRTRPMAAGRIFFRRQSFGGTRVPKRELGNQKNLLRILTHLTANC